MLHRDCGCSLVPYAAIVQKQHEEQKSDRKYHPLPYHMHGIARCMLMAIKCERSGGRYIDHMLDSHSRIVLESTATSQIAASVLLRTILT